MTTTDAYVAAVRALVEDLPTGAREELLEDLAAHLAELGAETGPSLGERLGPPSAYAREFVASAGLTAPAGDTREPAPPSLTASRVWLADFRPTWWALRPFLVALAAVLIVDRKIYEGLTRLVLLALAVVGAAAAVAWSTRAGRAGRRSNVVWTGVGVLAVVAVFAALSVAPFDRVVFAGPKFAAVRFGVGPCAKGPAKTLGVGPDGRPSMVVTPDGAPVSPKPGGERIAGPFQRKVVPGVGACFGPALKGTEPVAPGFTTEPPPTPPTTAAAPSTTPPPPGP